MPKKLKLSKESDYGLPLQRYLAASETVNGDDADEEEDLPTKLYSSSLKARTQGLAYVLQYHDQDLDIDMLLPCALLYNDRTSRKTFFHVIQVLVKEGNENTFLSILKFVRGQLHEALKANSTGQSLAISTRSSLLHLVCILIKCSNLQESKNLNVALRILSVIYHSIALDQDFQTSSQHRSARNVTRRAFRNNPNLILPCIRSLCDSQPTLSDAPLIGLLLDVALHLKLQDGVNEIVVHVKEAIIKYMIDHIISSKTLLPIQYIHSFTEFIQRVITAQDLERSFMPTIDKMLLRSPEAILPTLTCFFQYFRDQECVSKMFMDKFIHTFLILSKSAQPLVRNRAIDCFESMARHLDPLAVSKACQEFSTVLQSGKTASVDQRATLFQYLALLKSTDKDAGPQIIGVLEAVLPKETAEVVLQAVMQYLSIHLATNLTGKVASVLANAMSNPKANIRKIVAAGVGDALVTLPVEYKRNLTSDFSLPLFPALELNLKEATTNMLNSVTGPLEGYVAVTLLYGVFHSDSIAAKVIKSNSTLQGILNIGTKPSFLLWDKYYRKFSSEQELIWLSRAIAAVVTSESNAILSNTPLSTEVAQPLLFVAFEGGSHTARSAGVSAFSQIGSSSPLLAFEIIRNGLPRWLSKRFESEKHDNERTSRDISWQVKHLLAVVGSSVQAADVSERTRILAGLIVLCHLPLLAKQGQSLWITLLQQNAFLPHQFVVENYSVLKDIAWDALLSQDLQMRQAALDALGTLLLVAHTSVLPDFLSELHTFLHPDQVLRFSATDYAIFSHPASSDVPYVDVLSPSKPKQEYTKGKDQAIKKWEDEIRKSVQAKTTQNGIKSYSKSERALLDAQLKAETQIRRDVAAVFDRISIGLGMTRMLLETREETIKTLSIPSLVAAMMPLFRLEAIAYLSTEVQMTWTTLARVSLTTLSDIADATASAVLFASDTVILLDSQQDVLALLSRVLYRIHFLSQRTPLGIAPYSFIFPLLVSVISRGGVGVNSQDVEVVAEQVALAVDIIGAHCSAAESSIFPRCEMVQCLVGALVKYPHCSKSATDALVNIGGAIAKSTITSGELQALLQGLLQEEAHIRYATLQALEPIDLEPFGFIAEVWLSCHDAEDRNTRLATLIQNNEDPNISVDSINMLLPFLDSPHNSIRIATGKSLHSLITLYPNSINDLVNELTALYLVRNVELKPELDSHGLIIESTLNREDPWKARSAIVQAFGALSTDLASPQVLAIFKLFLEDKACADRHPSVRSSALDAAVLLIDDHGKANLQLLMEMFKKILDKPSRSQDEDVIVESAIVMYGRLARHMETTDERLGEITERLVSALELPSEVVQVAVSECFPALIRLRRREAKELITRLLRKLLSGQRYAIRRGAAFGLAGIVKGLGLTSLKQYDIISEMRAGLADKKSEEARQGSMFLLECLASSLGRTFEPYVVQVLPEMLAALGDASVNVREATSDASRIIMGAISSYAVKLILPTLLKGLDERQWRSKRGAIELLGSMSYLAPRQLAMSLPAIIPRLSECLSDSHKEVRSSANASLKRLGEVATNPEIQNLQAVILAALVNPASKTLVALETLTTTTFVHFIDSNSLALLVPILDRGLKERTSETKKKASQMLGMLANLTDGKDLSPYLSQLTPLVRNVLVDPVPEARATAAQALGSLVRRLGEEQFPSLIDSLLDVLQSNSSGVDQQGAAQGLAEILGGLGTERLDDLLPDILKNTSNSKAFVREGYISLLVFLPSVFGERFAPYLVKIISPILNGLADDSDYVRDASMRAGRMIVSSHSGRAVDLLLPELEVGLLDPSWRIRQSSMQLVGELLFRLVGITSKASDLTEDGAEEPEEERTTAESTRTSLLEALGKERRDRVLSYLYIVRQDPSGQVRQLSVSVWKALVSNTPRTVRELLPVLVLLLVQTLSNAGQEQRDTASRTLGELCRKLGSSILKEVIPILQKAMTQGSQSPRTRQGICLAYVEIMQNCSEDQLEGHESAIIHAVQSALVDEDEHVRAAAARAFDAMQQFVGPKAVDETIPILLNALQGEGSAAEAALGALKEVMNVRASAVIPVLVPTLTKQPISISNAKALSALVSIAGAALSKRLVHILGSLSLASRAETDENTRAELSAATHALFSSIRDVSSLNTILMHLLSLTKDVKPNKRMEGCQLFASFCTHATIDHSEYDVDWIRQLVSLFDDRASEVVTAAWEAMSNLVKTIDKEDMERLSVPLRRTVENTGTPGHGVPGFCLPNGLRPVLPIFLQGLLAGTAEQREQSAYGLSDLVQRTPPDALKPFVPQIAGPLIRIISERVPAPVKTAILTALTTLLVEAPALIRPFYPQIQRTFVKNVGDTVSSSVRARAAIGLGALMSHQPRIDPLITELVTGAIGSEESEVRESFASALAKVILSGGKNISPAVKPSILNYLEDNLALPSNKDTWCSVIARCLAALAKWDATNARKLLQTHILEGTPQQISSLTLLALLEDAPESALSMDLILRIASRIVELCSIPEPHIARPAREARELLKCTEPFASNDSVQSLL